MKPLVVGLGGTLNRMSSSEVALGIALDAAAERGADVIGLTSEALVLPYYDRDRDRDADPPEVTELVELLRRADGVIVSGAGYHGTVSGLLKNALDYAEDLAGNPRPYLDRLPFGCIGVAHGVQAAVGTMHTLRLVGHSLRAVPTNYGAAVLSGPGVFTAGACHDPTTVDALKQVGRQVADCTLNWRPSPAAL